MTCFPCQGRVASLRPQPSRSKLDEVEIDGTWDFKWRRGAIIRVAFQAPPEKDPARAVFEKLIPKVIHIASSWGTEVECTRQIPALADRPVPPSGARVPLTLKFLNARNQILPPRNGTWMNKSGSDQVSKKEAILYDVLISLATLPIVLPKTASRDKQNVRLPRSEMGRFARRLEYGTPTAFLGAFRRKQLLYDFAGTREWRHIVLHEFGHILGLAHPYQQPNVAVKWRTTRQLDKLLPALLGIELSKEELDSYIKRHLRARLPNPGKEPNFSDEWEPPFFPSVMDLAFRPALEVGQSADPYLLSQGAASPFASDAAHWLTEPQEADRQHLERMYPLEATLKDSGVRPPARARHPRPSGPADQHPAPG